MYGWRGKLGIIYPATGGLDQEFWKFVPEGVTVFITRLTAGSSIVEKLTVEALVEMTQGDELDHAAEQLRFAGAHSIGFAETSATFVKGKGYDKVVAERISKAAGGIPATTTSTAILDALHMLKVQRLAIGSPYPRNISELFRVFLNENGFRVVNMKILGLENSPDTQKQPPEVAYNLGRSVDTDEAEAIVIPCTDFRTAEAIQKLEIDLGKPVVTAVQATMWKSLRLAGVRTKVHNYGRLLES